jgi:hypothetical protein
MKQIYSSPNLSMLFDDRLFDITQFKTVNEIPKDCDFVAITFFDNSFFRSTVEVLLTKSKFILIDLNELTSQKVLNDAEYFLNTYDNIEIVSAVQTNYASRIKFSGNWFMSPINFYSAQNAPPWAEYFLSMVEKNNFNKPFAFDCLLGKSNPVRDFIESKYKTSTYSNKFIFSYYKDDIKNGLWDFPLDKFCTDSGMVITYNEDTFTPSSAIPYSVYNQSYYSVVSETVYFNTYSFFTEKIAKPILAKRPFVIFSGQHYLKNLKQLGFKTFDNVIDESYDNISDVKQRMKKVWEQVEYLTTQDPFEIYQQTQEIRDHNYNLFRTTDWTTAVKHIISNFENIESKTS